MDTWLERGNSSCSDRKEHSGLAFEIEIEIEYCNYNFNIQS